MTTGDDATDETRTQGRRDQLAGGRDELADGAADGRGPAVSRRSEQGVEIVTLSGELDFDSVQDVGPHVDEALGANPVGLVVDLSHVSFADSSALNLLLRTHSRTRLHLSGPLQPFVERLFDVTGLSGVLVVHPGLDEAVRAAAARD